MPTYFTSFFSKIELWDLDSTQLSNINWAMLCVLLQYIIHKGVYNPHSPAIALDFKLNFEQRFGKVSNPGLVVSWVNTLLVKQ